MTQVLLPQASLPQEDPQSLNKFADCQEIFNLLDDLVTLKDTSISASFPDAPAELQTVAEAAGLFLRHGYALQPERKRVVYHMLNKEAAELRSALPSSIPRRHGEDLAANLRQDSHFGCFPLFTADLGMDWILKKVPRAARCFFSSEAEPPMPIEQYVAKLVARLECSVEALAVAVVLVARTVSAGLPFTPRSAHRLFATALSIGMKLRDDEVVRMTEYAELSGFPLKELLRMETIMYCDILEFDVGVAPVEYFAMLLSFRSCFEQLTISQRLSWSSLLAAFSLPEEGEQDDREHQAAEATGHVCSMTSSRGKTVTVLPPSTSGCAVRAVWRSMAPDAASSQSASNSQRSFTSAHGLSME